MLYLSHYVNARCQPFLFLVFFLHLCGVPMIPSQIAQGVVVSVLLTLSNLLNRKPPTTKFVCPELPPCPPCQVNLTCPPPAEVVIRIPLEVLLLVVAVLLFGVGLGWWVRGARVTSTRPPTSPTVTPERTAPSAPSSPNLVRSASTSSLAPSSTPAIDTVGVWTPARARAAREQAAITSGQ